MSSKGKRISKLKKKDDHNPGHIGLVLFFRQGQSHVGFRVVGVLQHDVNHTLTYCRDDLLTAGLTYGGYSEAKA